MMIKHTLTEQSLELCTENLGSETGSYDNHIIEKSILPFSTPFSPTGGYFSADCHLAKRAVSTLSDIQSHNEAAAGNKKVITNFPPPLTTISGTLGRLSFWSHSEDGQLILKAVKVESTPTIFQAERSNGRLRLSLLRDHSFEYKEVSTDENEDNNELGLEEEVAYFDEEVEDEEIDVDECLSEGENDYFEIRGEIDQKIYQRPLISSTRRCKAVGECENLLRWGVAI
jgi:hypothetical protein